jgi:hypothetical protein
MSMILLLGLLPLVHDLVLDVVVHLWTLSEKVSVLAAFETRPRVPSSVHPVLVHPLERFGQQRQLVLSKHVDTSCGKDIKEEKESILVDGLALLFPFEPPMRARL